jgi:hypothetical protein
MHQQLIITGFVRGMLRAIQALVHHIQVPTPYRRLQRLLQRKQQACVEVLLQLTGKLYGTQQVTI